MRPKHAKVTNAKRKRGIFEVFVIACAQTLLAEACSSVALSELLAVSVHCCYMFQDAGQALNPRQSKIIEDNPKFART